MAIVDTITSICSGIIVFGILGNLAYESGADSVAQVVRGGVGLAFVSYPEAIAKFEFYPQAFSAIFFLMLLVLGVGCVVGYQISLVTAFQDIIVIKKQFLLFVVFSVVQFLIGIIYLTPVITVVNCIFYNNFILKSFF